MLEGFWNPNDSMTRRPRGAGRVPGGSWAVPCCAEPCPHKPCGAVRCRQVSPPGSAARGRGAAARRRQRAAARRGATAAAVRGRAGPWSRRHGVSPAGSGTAGTAGTAGGGEARPGAGGAQPGAAVPTGEGRQRAAPLGTAALGYSGQPLVPLWVKLIRGESFPARFE